MKSCAFTGHRPSGFSFGLDESDIMCRGIICALRVQIKNLYNMGVRNFYTGCAKGVDTWAAEIVIAEKERHKDIKLIAAIPFKGCDEIITLSDRFYKGVFLKRDRFMVDNSDAVIAVYDEENHSSGTGYTVRYALKKNKTVVIINPKNLEDRTVNIENLK